MTGPYESTDPHQHLCENCGETVYCSNPLCDGAPVTCGECLVTLGVVTTENEEEFYK
jgi:hypothetical protein